MRSLFVTGTDTGIGKTTVACALLRAFADRGVPALGMKPVASGCRQTPAGLRNDDAERLIATGSHALAYVDVNPYAFAAPIAPHVAAADAGVEVSLATITHAHARLRTQAAMTIVEGAGGWMAPLSDRLMQRDLVHALDLDVVIVVGLRLGCINHALLTVRAVQADGCHVAGWIANRLDPHMLRAEDSIATLRARIDAPLLGVIAHGTSEDQARDAFAGGIAHLVARGIGSAP